MTWESRNILMRSAGLLEAGDGRSALAELDKIPDAERWGDGRYWMLVALARHALGEYQEAIAAANWALSVTPHDAQLYTIRFDAERDAGLFAKAELSILTAIRLQPAEVRYHVAYAWLLASAGQLEKAERVNAAARRIAADHVEVVWQAAELARLQHRDVEAVAHGYQLLETSAPEPLRRALLGRLLVDLEREFEGTDHLKQSGDLVVQVGLDPDSVALSNHWLLRPYRFIEWLGPVATPALLIAIAILLLALNLVTAALTVALVIWVGFLFLFLAVPLARLLRRFAPDTRPATGGRTFDEDRSE
jgi:tetratricopeptide (TPR) repeat protein